MIDDNTKFIIHVCNDNNNNNNGNFNDEKIKKALHEILFSIINLIFEQKEFLQDIQL